jgi:hypothetical protein
MKHKTVLYFFLPTSGVVLVVKRTATFVKCVNICSLPRQQNKTEEQYKSDSYNPTSEAFYSRQKKKLLKYWDLNHPTSETERAKFKAPH